MTGPHLPIVIYWQSERHTSNDEYEYIVTANLETKAECIPIKQIAKYMVPLESKAVWEKQDNIKKSIPTK